MDVVFKKDKDNKGNPFLDFMKRLWQKIKSFKVPASFYYFLILIAIGIGFYLLMLLENGYTLAYGGDYSAQYIPMGYHVWDYYHEWFRTGHFTLFDTTLYLGANSIGSNAYYGLFSPFNIIIILFPRTLVPQAIAVCSIIKLACAGLFFSFYMKNIFCIKDNVARICGIAYAFCGWGAFYLWYNNYQDILVFFPIVLWGIDRTIKFKKPWLLAIGVFLITICNYVLMVPYIICAFFYAMFRFFQQVNKNSVKDNFIILGLGVVGFLGGLLLALFIFLPAFMATMASPKLETDSYGALLKQYLVNKDFKNFFELLFSWKKAADQHHRVMGNRVYYPILEFFFPATTCRSLPTLELYNWDFDDMAVSLWPYVSFILFLVPALIQSFTDKKWSHLIGFALLMASLFTPVMYFLTMGFSNGYARWTLFIITSLIAYVGTYIDRIPNVAKWHIHIGFFFAIIGIVAAWILTWKIYTPDAQVGSQFIHRFVEDGKDFTNTAYTIEIVYVIAVYLTLFFLYNKKAFHILMTLFVSAEAITMGTLVTIGHGYDRTYNNGYAENERFRKVLVEIEKNDKSFYRVYSSIADAYSVNNGFINNYHTASFFHSLYNFEIDDFTLWTGLRNGTKSVSGDYRGKYQDIDNLLGVKYYFVSKQKSKYYDIEANNPNGYIANVPFDFKESEDYEKLTDEYFVFENETLSEFGYSYNTLYNSTLPNDVEGVRFSEQSIRNSIILATDAVVKESDSEEIARLYPEINITSERPSTDSLKELVGSVDYTRSFYFMNQTAKYYPFKDIPSIPDNFPATTYVIDEANGKGTWQYFVFYKPGVEGQPLFKAGTTLYVRGPFSGSQKYDFYFMDEDKDIFMYDAHDDDTTDNTNYMRAFYIRKDVYSLAVCGKYSQSYLYDSTLRMFVEDKKDYEDRKDALIANPVENVTYKQDKFTFETHYDNPLFVVSRIAYDNGWSIKAKDNDTGKAFDVEVYKGNGGFVSFVAPKGNISYTMTYMTPYLKSSYIISALSFTGFFVSLVGYHIYQEKRRTHRLDNIFREN